MLLLLAPFSFDHPNVIGSIYRSLSNTFETSIKTVNTPLDYKNSFNSERNQYHSTKLIHNLLKCYPEGDTKVLGITSLDLFIPILTFVFGEAQLNGKAAVVSSFRLKPEYYGLSHDKKLLEDRLIKESIHELGHTYGLIHCRNYECVMHSSTYVEEIDIKRASFCPDCQKNLASNKGQTPPFAAAASK